MVQAPKGKLPYKDTDIRWRYPEGIINNDALVVSKRLGHAMRITKGKLKTLDARNTTKVIE